MKINIHSKRQCTYMHDLMPGDIFYNFSDTNDKKILFLVIKANNGFNAYVRLDTWQYLDVVDFNYVCKCVHAEINVRF